ncbi:MAG: 16S rRNA (adenine(1518)-N(6)/adenine(1519)-N(6))-dimethyltransferase RsmA [Sediminibacterium sp.]|jgi:16S rRNA (adenine1518-N6/adenine1519-N6)-dimethyltransferase|nr:ribosomal RNA small subunit methyltransferase A [Chitinophagaceae bacterium]MCA6447972.1 ribosomal RNA small subunit methyltransferase A [Chitinophagaceae bacterium]
MQYTLKKSLGQHFLTDSSICKKINDVLLATHFSQLVEVGPGGGALTSYLLQIPGIQFKAIELDAEKVAYLLSTFPTLHQKIIEGNILDVDVPFEGDFTVIGNFPYNISTQIVFKILDWKLQVPMMIGMFQKEVAERIVSKPNTKVFGILSVLVQAYYDAEYLFDVPAAAFNPPPKVVSGVIQLTRKKEPIAVKSDKLFFMLVKAAFNQRRKMLRNPLKQYFDESVLQEEIFTKRPEQLSVEDFAALTFRMK